MFAPQSFWISITCIFMIVTWCSMINANLHKLLDTLIPWLTKEFKPLLLKAHYPNQARDLTLNRLPILEEWKNGSQNYGLITLIIQVLLFTAMVLVEFAHSFPYILLMAIMCLLGSMVMFFPRTLTRRGYVLKATGLYFIAYAAMLNQIKNEKLIDDINNSSDIGTNPHS